ncbi:DUF1275 family protein [Streptomyces pseudogriseolus]|uniref:DUF1275 family protein n=1 Tax=Streptomyces pseudogriseolus TaxID=36817 RepID=UPI0036A50D99
MTVLTVIAGAVDAVSFLTLGKVFCALATGNVLFLSFGPAGEGGTCRWRGPPRPSGRSSRAA